MSIQTQDLVNVCKRRPVLCVCMAIAVCLLLTFYFRKDALAEAEVALEEKTKLLRKLSANIKYADGLSLQTELLRKANGTIEENTLKVGDLALNQQLFLRLEAETGVKLVDLRPQAVRAPAKGEAANAYVPIGFALSVSGTYQQVMLFVQRIEQGISLARITSAATGEAAGDELYNMSLNVEILGRR